MGNQASKILAANNSRKKGQSKSKQRPTSNSIVSQGNYDWLDQDPHSSNENMALDAAVSAAVALQQQKNQKPEISQSVPAPPSPTIPKFNNTRRKSISEFFARRKQSMSSLHPAIEDDDRKEYDRLQRQHYLLKSTRKGNFWAPIQSPKVIVEAGTGGGIWALEVAVQYPDCQVLGLDIKPPAFQHGNPTNLRYNRINVNESWPMNDNTVDFIFQRNMYLYIQQDQWPIVLKEMFRVLKPGGYIELFEPDFWHHSTGPMQQAFRDFYEDLCKAKNVDSGFSRVLAGTIIDSGFQEVDKRILDIPIGEWPTEPELKQYGFINKEIQKTLLKIRKTLYVPKWGISPSEYDLAVASILEEFEEFETFSRFNCWIARKPL